MQDIKRKDGFYLTYVVIKFIVRNTFALCIFLMTAMWAILKILGPFIEAFNDKSSSDESDDFYRIMTDRYEGPGAYREKGPIH